MGLFTPDFKCVQSAQSSPFRDVHIVSRTLPQRLSYW